VLKEQIQVLDEKSARLDDVVNKFADLNAFCQNVEANTEKSISKIKMQFDDLLQEFTKSEEISRVSRRTADDLQEEYCRVVISVAAERRRNEMFLDQTKSEFEKEITYLAKKVSAIDEISRQLNELKDFHQTS
jgi:DNA repair exonuclease SbcCD ATPase subunit